MSRRGLLKEVGREMEKDGLDLLEQVIALIIGGVLGGMAFQVAIADIPYRQKLLIYVFIFALGVIVLGLTHFFVSFQRVLLATGNEG